jgi:hypothetical protein
VPEEVTPQGQVPEENAEVETPEGEEPNQEVVEEGNQEDPSKEETSPLWEGISEDHPVREEIKKLRKEAADRRTTAQQAKAEADTLREKLGKAKTPEEVQELVNDYEGKVSALQATMLRTQIANEFRLPADLAELLKGEDEEELKAHAEKLSQYVPKGQTPSGGTPRGGRNPSQSTVSIEDVVKQIESNRR